METYTEYVVIDAIEERVIKLAALQTELKSTADKIAADPVIEEYTAAIAELEKQASEGRDALYDLVSAYGQDHIVEQIDEIKDHIIDEWTGEHKTMPFDAGTLKFTSRGSLKIYDEAWLMNDILDRMSVENMFEKKYLKGFNLTAVKKYMGVHDLPIDVAEIEYTTTVKLEQKE